MASFDGGFDGGELTFGVDAAIAGHPTSTAVDSELVGRHVHLYVEDKET